MNITVTDVRVKKYDNPENKIKAIASITIDDTFVIHDIKVIDSEKGYWAWCTSNSDYPSTTLPTVNGYMWVSYNFIYGNR